MGFGGGFFFSFHLYQKRPSSSNGIAEDVAIRQLFLQQLEAESCCNLCRAGEFGLRLQIQLSQLACFCYRLI